MKVVGSPRAVVTRDLHRERPQRRTENLMEALGIILEMIGEYDTSQRMSMTADQIGELHQVSGRTVREWHRAGIIPAAVNIGRVIRFDPAEVEAALRAIADKAAKKRGRLSLG